MNSSHKIPSLVESKINYYILNHYFTSHKWYTLNILHFNLHLYHLNKHLNNILLFNSNHQEFKWFQILLHILKDLKYFTSYDNRYDHSISKWTFTIHNFQIIFDGPRNHDEVIHFLDDSINSFMLSYDFRDLINDYIEHYS